MEKQETEISFTLLFLERMFLERMYLLKVSSQG